VTAEKCSLSHLLAHLEANSRWLVQRQRTPDGRVLFINSAVHPTGDGVLRVKAIATAKILQGHFTL